MLNLKNPQKEKVAVIADDLTGANEIAAIIAREGKKSFVLHGFVDEKTLEELWERYEGIVFNLNSRNLSEKIAYRKVKNLISFSKKIRKRLIYKKIDSTMRGNVGEEIDAILDTGCVDIAVLVPALPEMKRITVGGYHIIEGLPLSQTFYAEGKKTSFLPEIVRAQSKYLVGYIDLKTIESGLDSIVHKLLQEYKKEKLILVCDCYSRENLKYIKEAIIKSKLKVLPVGSAGLFEELFCTVKFSFLPSLIICGSLNRLTRMQLNLLLKKEKAGYLELHLNSIFSGKEEDELKDLKEEGEIFLAQRKDLIIATPEKSYKSVEKAITKYLAVLGGYFLKNYPLAGVIATGGDTAMALLENLEAEGIEIIDEIEPFIPVGIIHGGKAEGKAIITKTGGFGQDDVFLKAVKYLKKRSSQNLNL